MARQRRPRRDNTPMDFIFLGALLGLIGSAIGLNGVGWGWVLAAAGSLIIQVGVIAKGVEVGLRAHADRSVKTVPTRP